MLHGLTCFGPDRVRTVENWLGTELPIVTTVNMGDRFDEGIGTIVWDTDGDKGDSLREHFGPNSNRRLIVNSYMANGTDGHYRNSAQGDYDEAYRRLARELIDLGMQDTLISPNDEMNLSWSSEYPEDPANYRETFARVVREMQSVDGADFTFMFSPTSNRLGVAPECWPADGPASPAAPSWDDSFEQPITGPSFYDSVGAVYPDAESDVTPDHWREAWETSHKPQLDMWTTFAEERGAPAGTNEWGGAYNWKNGGYDNPHFIEHTLQYMLDHDWVLANYWNVDSAAPGTHQLHPGDKMPNAAAKYKEMILGPVADSAGEDTTDEDDNTDQPPMTRNATLDMTLDLRGQLTVTVTDTTDAPVADATVGIDGPTTGEVTTDSEGVAVFAPIAVGAYSVRATFEGVEATGEVAESDFQ